MEHPSSPSKGKKSVRFREDELVATLFINSDADDSDNDSSDFSVSMNEPGFKTDVIKSVEGSTHFETLFDKSAIPHVEPQPLKTTITDIQKSSYDSLYKPKSADPVTDLISEQINNIDLNPITPKSHSSTGITRTVVETEVESSSTKKNKKSRKLKNASARIKLPKTKVSSEKSGSSVSSGSSGRKIRKSKKADIRNPTHFEMDFAKLKEAPSSFDLTRGILGTVLTTKRRQPVTIRKSMAPKMNCINSDPKTMNDYFIELKRQKIAKSILKGKIIVQYVESTDNNVQILYNMFNKIKKMTSWPSVEGVNERIASLETSFKAVALNAPDGFDPHVYKHWQLLRSSITDVEYLPEEKLEVHIDSAPVPLTTLPFNGLVIPGSCLRDWTTYGLSLDSCNCNCEGKTLKGERIAFIPEDEPEDSETETQSDLKVMAGNAYRFPKLKFPPHTSHPLVRRLRNKIAKVTFKSPYLFLSRTPPMSPSFQLVPKNPTQVNTLCEKPSKVYSRPQSTGKYFDPSLDESRKVMLTKTRAELNFHPNRSKEPLFSPCSKAHIVRYKPEQWDYSTVHKSTYCFPHGQQSIQQTTQSLFKQIPRYDEICRNPKCKHCRPPPNLYQELMDDDVMISLNREEVFDLIDTLPDVPLYVPIPGCPGHYSPCEPPAKDDGYEHEGFHITNCFKHKKPRTNFCCLTSPEESENEVF